MLKLPKYCVSVSSFFKTERTNLTDEAIVTNILIDNEMMSIERVPNNKLFAITGAQANEKGVYVLYLKNQHPEIPQQATVTWEMHNKTYTGLVKFTQPMAQKILGFNRECYIQSNNQ